MQHCELVELGLQRVPRIEGSPDCMTGNLNKRGRGRTVCLLWPVLLVVVIAALLVGCGPVEPAGDSGSSSASKTARGTPAEETADSGAHFSFMVCGDPQNNYAVFDRILAAARSVDFLIIAGDLTGSGTPTEFGTFTEAMRNSGVRYYCVPGNHDVATGPAEQIYASYLGPTHQSFDYQNSHFLLIDNSSPELGFYPSERSWAAADLQAARKRNPEHVIAVCHVPPGYQYSLNPAEAGARGEQANGSLAPVLSQGGVEELFCGHLHGYARENDDGLPITITGGAGAPLRMSAQNGGYYNYVLVRIDGRKLVQNVVRIDETGEGT